MKMRCPAFLRFDGAEVLHVPSDAAAGVLPESIDQGGEVDRVSRGPSVVIVLGVYRRPVIVYAPVGIERERHECGRPVASSEHLPDRPLVDRSARQVWGILAAPGGALDRLGWWIERGKSTAYPGCA